MKRIVLNGFAEPGKLRHRLWQVHICKAVKDTPLAYQHGVALSTFGEARNPLAINAKILKVATLAQKLHISACERESATHQCRDITIAQPDLRRFYIDVGH